MNCQKTESGNYAYPPAPGYNKNYPSPYEKNKGKIPASSYTPAEFPKEIIGKMDLRDVVFEPELPAEFPGTIKELRNKINENFDKKEYGKVDHTSVAFIYLIINQEGAIFDIYVSGPDQDFNQLLKLAVEKIKTPWKPALNNKKEVKTLIQLPFRMYFE